MLTGTPLDLTPFGAALQGIGVLYWLFVLGVITIILLTVEGWWWKAVCVVLALALSKKTDGKWHGLIKVKGLSVVAECMPTGTISGGAGSAGTQVFSPPASSGIQKLVRVGFAGHKVQECRNDSSWQLRGSHPLAGGVLLPPSTFQFGYDLVGGSYAIDPTEIK